MSGSAKLPKEVRTQLGVGAILTIVGMVWMFVIFFVLKPDQIVPTKDDLSDAYDGMRAIAGIPFDHWDLRTIRRAGWKLSCSPAYEYSLCGCPVWLAHLALLGRLRAFRGYFRT